MSTSEDLSNAMGGIVRQCQKPSMLSAYSAVDNALTSGDASLMEKIRRLKGEPALNRLSALLEPLNPRRRELIRKILQEPRAYVLLSVRAAAEQLGTDSGTLVRTAQRMGFENYHSFKNYLQELSILNATALDGMESADTLTDGKGTFKHYIRAVMEQDVRNLTALRASLDVERLKALAKRIHQAKHRLVIGADMSESLVHYLGYCFATLGVPFWTSTSVGQTIHFSRMMQKNDLLIAISFHKGLRQIVESMKRAKVNGICCVGITGTYMSPIAQLADEFFVAPVESASFADSYAAPITLANLILAAAANYHRSSTLKHLQDVADEQKAGFRWYESE